MTSPLTIHRWMKMKTLPLDSTPPNALEAIEVGTGPFYLKTKVKARMRAWLGTTDAGDPMDFEARSSASGR